MLHTLLVVVHVIICFVLAIVVLLQSSKGGGLAGAFGGAGGAPQQLLGSRGMTTLLHKLTIYCAVGFFLTSFLLFMTESSGDVGGAGVISKAAREGGFDVPLQETVVPNAAVEMPVEAPADVPSDADDGSN
ncbi:MAG: preprotein translocase subunit SecG [Gemmatimonadales bacterium]|nr:preprotein translocase subunit SecG [Gemmatimonadales bacterium]